MKYYHIALSKLNGYRYVLRNLSHILVVGDEDLGLRSLSTIYYRLGNSKYWDNIATRQSCGCSGYQGHFTGYVLDCTEHGLDRSFPRWQ